MDKKTLKTLEFDKILEMAAAYTKNEAVKMQIRELLPETDPNRVRELLADTECASGVILRRGTPPGFYITDVSDALFRVQRGGSMTARELLALTNTLRTARRVKSYIGEDKAAAETTVGYLADTISDLKKLENEIGGKLLSEEEIADDASGELLQIRRSIRSQTDKIKETLNTIINSSHYRKFLQDALITVRGDRFVIPVKAEHKNEVRGIVHDSSASGSTVFVEPASVVEKTNLVQNLHAKEREEIDKILRELSVLALSFKDEILSAIKAVFALDFIFCKGQLAIFMHGQMPNVNADGKIVLKGARHPLLDQKKVVPIDISLGDTYDTLVITGPNTGGKTVSLKTLGLFTLMAQAGLHIPVKAGSSISVFDNVFADIGDEQSIEQNLSTFSSHIVNLVSVQEKITPNSFVLADELGAGTDPTEGAALAISMIEYFRSIGAKVAATTHYSELKLYALSTPGVMNGSCEFDLKTLSPTYRLMIGVPGKSNAFAISKRLGVYDCIIENAKQRIADDDIKLEDVIVRLEENKKQAETQRLDAERWAQQAKRDKEAIRKEKESIALTKEKMLKQARAEAMAIIEDAKAQTQSVLKELREVKSSAAYREALEKTEAAKQALKAKSDRLGKAAAKTVSHAPTLKTVKLGQTVHVLSLDNDASVLTLPDKKGSLYVQAGIMKIKTNLNDLTLTKEEQKSKQNKRSANITYHAPISKTGALETDVRGMYLEDAIRQVDKFLDDSYLSGLHEVTVIHGKGTGILRHGIGDFLQKHPVVKSFRGGRYGEGESGVTVVTLKDK